MKGVRLPTRSVEQNTRMWRMLRDVARQVEWPVNGRMQLVSAEEWKDIFSAALRKEQRIAQGIDGGFVLLGMRTSKLTVQGMCDLVALMDAFGAERDPPVQWTPPKMADPNEVPA